MKCKNSSS